MLSFAVTLGAIFRQLVTPTFWHRLVESFCEISRALWRALRRLLRGERRRRREEDGCCIYLPPSVYKRADPLLYAQYHLMAQGLAVTWDNPDIVVLDGATEVSGQLKPDHAYRVRVRVWNGSYDAPAVGMDVGLSYLSFGVQTLPHAIAATTIDLGVKGSAHEPAYAEFNWTTPAGAGHYCLQAQLGWADDANPDNNLGQKNIDVAAVQSPARFQFRVRNAASVPRRFHVEADAYVIPPLARCDAVPGIGPRDGDVGIAASRPADDRSRGQPVTRLGESRTRWERARRKHARDAFPVPPDWDVEIVPDAFSLDARQERDVEVRITPADPAFQGSRTFNLAVFANGSEGGAQLAGGVTLTAVKA